MKQNSFFGVSEEGFHRIAYTEWGNQDPLVPTVICVHGYTRNSRDFDSLANYLSMQKHHVFCPDIVGRGDSSWLKNSNHYNFTQYVRDMCILIARTNAQQIDWIGTSMGGIIGMLLAALPNTPIRRLVLNDIGPQVPLEGLRRLASYAGKDTNFKSLDEAKSYFKKNYNDFGISTEQQWDDFTQHSIKQQGPNLYIAKVDPAIKNPKSITQLISDFFHSPNKALEGIFFDIDLWNYWEGINCPVLVIHGSRSDLLTPEIIRKMKRTHSKTEVHEVENAGHAPALLDLREQEKINQWLTRS